MVLFSINQIEDQGIGTIASPRLPIIGYKGDFSALRDGSNAVYQNTVLRLLTTSSALSNSGQAIFELYQILYR